MGAAQAIWIALGGNAVFLLVVAFLGKRLITQWLDKDLERFKAELHLASVRETDRLRGALEIAAAEHSIMLSRLQDRRATVIDELYELLAKAVAEVSSYLQIFEFAGEPNKDEKAGSARRALQAFMDYFDRKQIWLPPDCCTKVAALVNELRKHYNEFSWSREDEKRGRYGKVETWYDSWKAISETTVPPARGALEAEMRRLLEPTRAHA